MRYLALSILLIGVVGSLDAGAAPHASGEVPEGLFVGGIPDIPGRVFETLEPYGEIRTVSLHGWSPTGRGLLISGTAVADGQIALLKDPGGVPLPITESPERVRGAWPGGGTGFIYEAGNQLFFHDMIDGTSRPLTGNDHEPGGVVWADDGHRFAWHTIRRQGANWVVQTAGVPEAEKPHTVLGESGAWFVVDWSPDGQALLAGRHSVDGRVLFKERILYSVVETASGRIMPIPPLSEDRLYPAPRFTPDGQGLYLATDIDSEYISLHHFDLATEALTPIAPEVPWDILEMEVSPDGRSLAFVTNEAGISRLHLRSLPGMKKVKLPPLPDGHILNLQFSPDSSEIAFELNAPRIPRGIYSVSPGQRRVEEWYRVMPDGLEEAELAHPEQVEYPTFDREGRRRRRIPAFIYKPSGPGPFPVVVTIHGGPAVQSRMEWDPLCQYMVTEMKTAVVTPNIRGSSGYGRSYMALDDGYRREDAIKDIGALLDWIRKQPDLDEERVVLFGGSYGGYVVFASMARYNDRLRGGITRAGISNLATFLEGTADYRREVRREEYGDERVPEMRGFMESIAPLHSAGSIQRPLFVAHGLEDARVPVGESRQMAAAVKENGTEVWYLFAGDEGHSIENKESREYFEAAIVLFLEKNLKRVTVGSR